MATILDYIDWRGDLTLAASPFNEVDNLLMAEMCFLDFTAIVPPPGLSGGVRLQEAAAAYFAQREGSPIHLGRLVPDAIPDMFCRMASSERFSNMRLNGYEELFDMEREQQFAAITVDLGDGSIYVAFRGTDDTLVGWKEDMNLSFLDTIPSQVLAADYLARMAEQYAGATIRVGGHSKGGNLAVYSAIHVSEEVQKRILAIYNNDGPGFVKRLIDTPEHSRVAKKIYTIVPQSSVVGRLLEHEDVLQVVRSTAEGIYQHDGFSWEVMGPSFVHLDEFTRGGNVVDETIDSWADSLSPEQREVFSNAIYEVLSATGAKNLSELSEARLKTAATAIKTYQNFDRETRRALTGTFRLLLHIGAKNVAQSLREVEFEPLFRHMKKKTE